MIEKQLRTTFRRTWWMPLGCVALAWALSHTETITRAEWRSLDWRTDFRVDFQAGPDPRLALVFFDDQTEALLDQAWPVDRQYHAQLTQVLALAEARMVAWDVILDASREGTGDGAFADIVQAAAEAGTQVLSAAVTNPDATAATAGENDPTQPLKNIEGDVSQVIGDEYAFVPFPQLRQASLYGFADTPPGADGVRREIPLVVRVGQAIYPSLALQIVLADLGLKASDVRVSLGDALYFTAKGKTQRVPIDAQGRLLLNYRYDHTGKPTDFPVYNYGAVFIALSEFFSENKTQKTPPPNFKDSVVIVGQTVTGKADIGPSPLNRLSPLSFVIANAVNNILREDYARRVPAWIAWAMVLAMGYASVLLLGHRSVVVLCGSAVLWLVVYGSAALWLWVWQSWWLPWVAPSLGIALVQFLVIGRRIRLEQRAKQEIKGMFGAYVSPEVVDQMIKAETQPKLGGHLEEITAYFSDIQAFSTFSEQLPPDRLVELVNEYLTACTDIIHEEGGTLDKYIGDAIVAMFGAPIPHADHAYRACVASQRVQRKLAELCEKWRGEGDKWPPIVSRIVTRIGLNTGECVIGNMGSRTRFNYTMMGDNVNLASRMESGAKAWGARTLCTEATKLACEKHGGDRVVFRPLGRIVVKGRSNVVPIFEIVGLKEWVTPQTHACCAKFSAGLDRYYARDWEGALACFEVSAALELESAGGEIGVLANPSLVYIGMVREFKASPPPTDWNGVYIMKDK